VGGGKRERGKYGPSPSPVYLRTRDEYGWFFPFPVFLHAREKYGWLARLV